MRARSALTFAGLMLVGLAASGATPATLRGSAAYGSWRDDAPGVTRHFSPAEAKAPTDSAKSANNRAKIVPRPEGALPKVPAGLSVELFASGFKQPRLLRTAPNGDLFLAESGGGRILVFKADANGTPDGAKPSEFATGLSKPYGIAFFPPGDAPRYVYVAQPDKVLRFPYSNGDTQATGAAQAVIDAVPASHHWTRDLAVSPDGKQILLSVGSGSNNAEGMHDKSAAEIRAHEAKFGLGAAWGDEARRAALWSFAPDGTNQSVYANGLRNCTGLTVHPQTHAVWCVVNERDGLGDDVPFEYATTVKKGAFYGWPWYYIGDNANPRRKDERADLRGKVSVPDVLLQPHSAPLGIVFYEGTALPREYRGDAFVTFHGSWNRHERTGYKVVRLAMKDGKPTGDCIDFMTGFVVDDDSIWGRPVGVTVAKDGSIVVSEDGNGTLWRVKM